jgi:DNA-binding PadR family transcriptional regulator
MFDHRGIDPRSDALREAALRGAGRSAGGGAGRGGRNRRRDDWDTFPGAGFGGPGFGPGFGGGGRRGRRPGRRGDVRAAVLLLLKEEPLHGYQLIQQIGERSNGAWTPSPGSVYPVLSQLEDEGLITIERIDGRKTASLTDEGRSHVEEHLEELGSPWDDAQAQPDFAALADERRAIGQSLKSFAHAWRQVAMAGTPDQRSRALKIVDDARRALYAILAEDDEA